MRLIASTLRPSRRAFLVSLAASSVLLLTPLLPVRAGMGAPLPQDEFKVTTVFLVRHADKAATPREDPPLNDKGKLRAQDLARMLGDSGVKVIYTSQFLRTRQTAEPLAQKLGITSTPIPIQMNPANPNEASAQSIKEITDKIHERAGDSVLVIGHSNTIPEVIRMLGGDVVPKIDEKEFDDFFVVTVYGKGKAKVVRMKYGSAN